MSNIQLDDLTYSYPSIDNNNFQELLSEKYEFKELAAPKREEMPVKGEYYTHQEFIHRYLNVYDRLLIMARAGSGKTGSVIGFTEKNKNYILKGIHNYVQQYIKPNLVTIKMVYILVKGSAVANEIKKQIICNYSKDNAYVTKHVLEGTTKRTRENRLNTEIAKYYKIITYNKFYKLITTTYTDDISIKNFLSDILFMVDEVHNLRIDEYDTIDNDDMDDKSLKNKKLKPYIYSTLWNVFHTSERSKVVLLSATPAVNLVEEIPIIMNLILPKDKQMDPKINYGALPSEELKKYFSGYVSYILEQESYSTPNIEGKTLYEWFGIEYDIDDKIYKSQLKVVLDEMSVHQTIAYLKIKDIDEKFFIKKRKASLIAFPDGSTDNAGFNKYIKYDDDLKRYFLTDEFKEEISRYGIEKFSTKIADIRNTVNQATECCFIYVDFVKHGAIIIELILEFLEGYSIYDPKVKKHNEDVDSSLLCKTTEDKKENIRINKEKRIAILTEDNSEALLNIFNAKSNASGDYLKILIGTPRSKEGISLINVTSVIIVGPPWTYASLYQSIYRAIRLTSNQTILEEKKALAIKEGKNPDDVKIFINVRILCAIIKYNNQYKLTGDIEIAMLSEKKNIEISRLIRKMKECAIDAQIHLERNVANAKDYSQECDYDVCKITPVDEISNNVDYSSYRVLYTEKIINSYIEIIKDIIRKYPMIKIKDLYDKIYNSNLNEELNQINKENLIKAIYKLINEKIILLNKYGKMGYLNIDKDIIYFTEGLYEHYEQTKLDTYYSLELVSNNEISIKDVLYNLNKDKNNKLINELLNMVPGSDKYLEVLNKIDNMAKIKLVESDILNYLKTGLLTYLETTYYNDYISEVDEPYEDIRAIYNELIDNPKISKDNIESIRIKTPKAVNRVENKVFIHVLYDLFKEKSSYGVKSEKLRIRILNPSEKIGWRDVTSYEYYVYEKLALDLLESVSKDEVNVNDMILYKENDTYKIKNYLHPKGMNLKTVKTIEHIYILYNLGIPIPENVSYDRDLVIRVLGTQIKNYLQLIPEDLSDEILNYLYYFKVNKYKNEQLIKMEENYYNSNINN